MTNPSPEAFFKFAAAMKDFACTADTVRLAFALMGIRTPRDKQRLVRDHQRRNRRPALIHNGRRPR